MVGMSDAEDDDHTTFIKLTDDDDGAVVSRAGFQLHGFAMINSVRNGTPGFISDDYLNAISAETSVTATELCMAGLWERDQDRGGYNINDPMVADVVAFHEQMDRQKALCAATGGHETNEESGPDICCKCTAPRYRWGADDEPEM